jgi:hypothetical protein
MVCGFFLLKYWPHLLSLMCPHVKLFLQLHFIQTWKFLLMLSYLHVNKNNYCDQNFSGGRCYKCPVKKVTAEDFFFFWFLKILIILIGSTFSVQCNIKFVSFRVLKPMSQGPDSPALNIFYPSLWLILEEKVIISELGESLSWSISNLLT